MTDGLWPRPCGLLQCDFVGLVWVREKGVAHAEARGRARARAATMSTLIGQRVEIHGLLARPDLNGCVGVALAFDATAGRVDVQLDSVRGVGLKVRPASLRVVAEPATPSLPVASDIPALPCSAAELLDLLPLNLRYPGLRCVHKQPYIFLIDGFLPAETCNEIRARAATDLRMSLMEDRHDAEFRRSSCTHFNPTELPCVAERMAALCPAFSAHVYSQRVIRYGAGDFIGAHSDLLSTASYAGLRCTEPDEFRSGRKTQVMARVFCYLTDCDAGGGTHFHETALPPLQPRRGLACVFLQAHLSTFDAAPRLSHTGCPAVDEKFLLDTGWYSRDFGVVAGTSETHLLYPDARLPSEIPFKGDGPVR